ncbi:acetyl-CoA hydrolase/transferase family protein [Oharaeibacter diazotrophicus]|uniref:Succinyl-CoA:acetate CoA-transferase n=1 Tax=Oharaeibacter diazotrophicus TaxID=1920512 RepID=A0A4R6RKF4_9HYPH|nr:acetyl-CoA hydrolase/transferase family protein [Oharaeibacter diazotrophicus]TDP86417.1 succinyl-CoA:acetate CoA-transferase [Oharaeibacter diazotrophicus]BBE71640.1 succinyl-CoA:coenzyme A transferase [Pleomorphomonas sp. SM30]
MVASGERIANAVLRSKVMSADEAALRIRNGMNIGMSGFTGSGYPKALPQALARRIEAEHARGAPFRVGIWTGASTAPELDGALARADGIDMRLPYQSDPTCRARINAGEMEYIDLHLSHVGQFVWFGYLGHLDVAVIEATAILEDGSLVPSTSIGNNKTWLDLADAVIIEVNSRQSPALHGMHDVYYGTALPPHRRPIPILSTGDRIGRPTLACDLSKVVAVIETDAPDRNSAFNPPDAVSEAIAGHIIEFLTHEVSRGRLPETLLPIQSGVGNVANAVLAGLGRGGFEGLTSYTEVIQDGMLDLLLSGRMDVASATALSLSPAGAERFEREIETLRRKVVLRTQEISNHPEVIRRLGVIAMNGLIEADIYGNVNSTHVRGSSIMNGIGGSGDFARNAYLSIFMTPSTAKGGTISAIVPMATHVDHTEHDVQVIVTERGLADLRGHSPKQRARILIENCAHPTFQPALADYFERACRAPGGRHTPHILAEALAPLVPRER